MDVHWLDVKVVQQVFLLKSVEEEGAEPCGRRASSRPGVCFNISVGEQTGAPTFRRGNMGGPPREEGRRRAHGHGFFGGAGNWSVLPFGEHVMVDRRSTGV